MSDERADREAELERARARVILYSGLALERAHLDEVLAQDASLRADCEEGFVDIHALREGVAQLLIGASWPAPDALEPIAAAAAARGIAFTPVSAQVSLSPAELAESLETLASRCDLICAPELILETFRLEPDVYAAFVDCGRALDNDTALRETFIEVVCQRLVGRSWPIYADSPEDRLAFHRALEQAVRPGYFELSRAPAALLRRAGLHRQGGDLEGALERIKQALALEPASYAARLQRAAVRRAQGDHQAALTDLELPSPEDDSHLAILRLRGLALESLGRRAEALACCEDFLRAAEAPLPPGVFFIPGLTPRVIEGVRARRDALRAEV